MQPFVRLHRLWRLTVPTCYGYDGCGDLTAVYGRDGKKLRGFAYRNHIMTEHSRPDGLVSRYEYDRCDTGGKVLKSRTNLGEEWTFDYRDGHTRVTDALGREEVYGFDENFELVYRIDANGRRSDSERDGFGRITVERDEIGRETRYSYDTFGNVIAVTAPDGSRTQIDYHETLNLPVAVNDPAGRITGDGDGFDEEDAEPAAASAEEDPYGLAGADFDRYEQIYFSQLSDGPYQIASADGSARLYGSLDLA